MPIAPAAKGIIVVSSIVVAASVALYQNEQVQEWLQRTGQKVTAFWDDVVNFEQRQYQRRKEPMRHGAGASNAGRAGAENHRENGAQGGQTREGRVVTNEEAKEATRPDKKQARRTLWENAAPDVTSTGQQESADASGVRRRKARGASTSEEALLGSVSNVATTEAVQAEEEKKKEALFDENTSVPSLLDQADSVLDLVPEGVEGMGVKLGEKGENADQVPQPALGISRTEEELALLDLNTEPPTTTQPSDNLYNNPQTAPNKTTDPPQQHLPQPASPSDILASSHLNFSIPPAPSNPFEDSSYHTPGNLTLPHSPSFNSTPGTASPVDIHTPPAEEDDEDFETISEVGTETGSLVDLGSVSERLRDGQRAWEESSANEDDVRSVASSGISGWSDVGSER